MVVDFDDKMFSMERHKRLFLGKKKDWQYKKKKNPQA